MDKAMLETFLNKLVQIGTDIGLKILFAVIILVVGLKLSKWLIKWLNKTHGYQKLDAGVRTFLDSALRIVLIAVVIISAAYVVGVPITSFVTILASCGLAIGLALQGSLSNLAGGLMILIFKPFRVGDFIEANGKSGVVHDITVFYTILHTPDNKVVTIPNGTITASDITNYWTLEQARMDITCSTAYGDDINKTKDILLSLANAQAEILKDPAPQVYLDCMSDNSLDYILRVWVGGKDYWDVKYRMNELIKNAFDENNVSIPFPQLDIHNK